MSTRKILVTGGCGFIGCSFVRLLLESEPTVTVVNLDALTYAGHLGNLAAFRDHPRHIFVKADLRDPAALAQLFAAHQFEGVINFAAESHVDRSISGPSIFVETNVMGTLNLLQAARAHQVARYVQVSTDEVYGSLGDTGKFHETTPIAPNSPYSASKASADMLVRAYHHTYGMDTRITRCSNNYGPYQFPEKMLPLMFNNARHNKPLPVYGDGLNVRDWLYVHDHCTAIWAVYQRGQSGEVYNIGGESEKTNLEVVRAILAYLGKPESLITFVKDRPGHDRRYAMDATKITTELGWHPSVTFEQGLKQTLDWYSANQSWMDTITSGAYKTYYDQMYGKR